VSESLGASELHDAWNEAGGFETLQHDIGERFEDRVGYKEDRQSSIICAGCERMLRRTETLLEAINLRVSDIGTVEESEEIQNTELDAVRSNCRSREGSLPRG
jgi:hypothetical protein